MKDEFNELLNLEEKELNNIHIKRKMNIMIYKRIGIVLLSLSIVISGCFLYKKYTQKKEIQSYFDPYHFQIEDLDAKTSLQLFFQSAYHITHSGVELSLYDMKKIGEGKYRLDVQEISDFRSVCIGDKNELNQFIINKNNIEKKDTTFVTMLNEFIQPEKCKDYSFKLKEELQDIKELPQSSVLTVSINFDKYMNMEDLIKYMKKYPNTNFLWACQKNLQEDYEENGSVEASHPLGINLKSYIFPDLTRKVLNKYPYLIEFDCMNEAQLLQHYQSTIQLLNDYSSSISLKNIDHIIDLNLDKINNAMKEEITFIGVKALIKKDDLIKGIENGDMKYGLIEDIAYSKYE